MKLSHRIQQAGFWRLPIIRPFAIVLWAANITIAGSGVALLLISGVLMCDDSYHTYDPLAGVGCFIFGAVLLLIFGSNRQVHPTPRPRRLTNRSSK